MADKDDNRRERDMILAPNEFAFISDETKGSIDLYVGPNKTSLASSDRCVSYDERTRRFKATTLESGTQAFQTASEGWYAVLENPAEGDKFPSGSGKLSAPALRVGKRVNIQGPVSFALWPGQVAKVLKGHNLRSNEYLLCRVYDEDAAKTNISKAVVKKQEGGELSLDPERMQELAGLKDPKDPKPSKKGEPAHHHAGVAGSFMTEAGLSMGKEFIIRGTEVSFYIPPTGIEVVPEIVGGDERYVREAVTLETLEYCLLLDQNGNKRYVQGPAVVFPRPTEKFVEAPIKSNPEKAKSKKFRAQELTPNSGIHVRVIADYTADDGTKHKEGEELFITGREQTIYFPREEHAIIKYGEQDVHFGIAIPVGEARYVLNRDDGTIRLEQGPKIFLPDPRKEVIINRALPLNLCEMLYPGNAEALQINAARLNIDDQDINASPSAEAYLNSNLLSDSVQYNAAAVAATPDTTRRVMIRGASKALPGDSFDRKNKFTAPRSIVLNTKYDGAVAVTLWTGFAMLLVSKGGNRRVIQGPGTFMLEYDESPQVLTLSRGKPKTMDNPLKTVYLLTTANKVSDVVEVETKDFCRLSLKLSYRVNFEGGSDRWFNVDNYVKFMCDHMRSKVRSAVQKLGIEEFYGNHTEILRSVILGSSPGEGKPRPGTTFAENGMRIYDVEVLGAELQNPEVEQMLVAAQRNVVQNTLTLNEERRRLSYTTEMESLKRQAEQARADTQQALFLMQAEIAQQKLALDLSLIANAAETQQRQAETELLTTKARAAVALSKEETGIEARRLPFEQEMAEKDSRLDAERAQQALELEKLAARVSAHVAKAGAITPGLVEALQAFGDKALVERVAQSMAPLSIIGGESAVDVLAKLIAGTPLAKYLTAAKDEKQNGTSGKPARA